MRGEDVALHATCESWVREAVKEERYIDGGTFSVVYDAPLSGKVVKLTRSRAAYLALLEFSGKNIHFPL